MREQNFFLGFEFLRSFEAIASNEELIKQHNQLFINRAKRKKRQQLAFFIYGILGLDGSLNAEDFCKVFIYILYFQFMEDILYFVP